MDEAEDIAGNYTDDLEKSFRPLVELATICAVQPPTTSVEEPMKRERLAIVFGLVLGVVVAAVPHLGQPAQDPDKERRPKVVLRGAPQISFSPARVTFTAELRGGADDYEEFYCPTIEWDWGDGTQSESTQDCEPYEAGRSQIRRFYTTAHVYEFAGRYNVLFRLKRSKKVIVGSNTVVQVRPGIRDPSSD
jgi:hypothetical protein